MSSDTHLVFVYGTLRRGASNAYRMEGAEFVGNGLVRGRLYRVDWYPAIVLDDEAGWVKGELWKVGPEQLAELDQFEGSEYERIECSVLPVSEDGHAYEGHQGSLPALIWEWREGVDKLERIMTGDWID